MWLRVVSEARCKRTRRAHERRLDLFKRLASQHQCGDAVVEMRVASLKPRAHGFIAVAVGNHQRDLQGEAQDVFAVRAAPGCPLVHRASFRYAADDGDRRVFNFLNLF